MFKRGWLRRNWIFSDEGFSVQIARRDTLVYREGKRRMEITGEMAQNGYTILEDTVGRWDDDPGNLVGMQKKHEIVDRIRRALESQNEELYLL